MKGEEGGRPSFLYQFQQEQLSGSHHMVMEMGFWDCELMFEILITKLFFFLIFRAEDDSGTGMNTPGIAWRGGPVSRETSEGLKRAPPGRIAWLGPSLGSSERSRS